MYAAAVRLPVLAAQPIARAGYLSGAFLFSPPLRLGRRLQLLQRFKEGKALEAWRLPSPILRRSPLRHARRRQTVAASSSASGGSFSRVRVSHRDCNRCYRLPVNGRSAEDEKLFLSPGFSRWCATLQAQTFRRTNLFSVAASPETARQNLSGFALSCPAARPLRHSTSSDVRAVTNLRQPCLWLPQD